MRLGGFVIHGNNRDTLGACLESLKAVCDDVVAVDSCSTDGSAELSERLGVRSIRVPWQGYGAARAAGAQALVGCDYVLFLDSDEWLDDASRSDLLRWKRTDPRASYYSVWVRDWAVFTDRTFLFRRGRRVRIVHGTKAAWTPEMIIHESLPHRAVEPLALSIDHRFVTSLERRDEKDDLYALLWAVRAYSEGRSAKAAWLQRTAHFVRNAVVKGAVYRGGTRGLRLAWAVSRYHARKYEYLRNVQRGMYADQVAAYRERRYAELFARLKPA